ncbi:Hypothetical protein HEAR3035 [Herminiimonas arsenicoxydans]|uniref:Uncharacterized protein n=1 Tax=Herminiimonas arsenicoxydans TaxID=204773 RepID=A4G9F7_HERAR|nr:Hypothetical protein HEAR3035 [Herminiimonas arsenicoxydans]
MEDLETIDAPSTSKDLFAALIRCHAEQNGSAAAFERQERIKLARKLLDLREARSIISARLQLTYGIGRSQAYEDISKALQIVREPYLKLDEQEVK